MRVTFFAHYEGAIRTVAGLPMDCASVSSVHHECGKRLEARPRAHRVDAWEGGGWMTGRYVTSATRGAPVSGPELLAAMDAAPISRETCDAVLDGMAANETAAEAIAHRSDECATGDDPCLSTCCMPTPRDADGEGEAT